MNILLVNNDAVIAKLVRLSTQKTGDRLDIATSIDEVREESYDLLILDGGLFNRTFLERLNDKAIYAHSIFITTRETEETSLFEKQLHKPFLPTELLVMLHQFATSVKQEQEERSKEIVFDDFESDFFSEDEIVNTEDTQEQETLRKVHKFENISEELIEESREEEPLENIFSEQEVSEVKAILDALGSDEESEEELVEAVINLDSPLDGIDEELERALTGVIKEELAQTMEPLREPMYEQQLPSHKNQESIETLQTLLKALENPQIAKSLRGTITINLTFGDD